jgi:signal transduction histidine kinase/predicted O-methyltransferase YrrM
MPDILLNGKDNPIRRVLIVDDEISVRMILIKALTKAGFYCREAETGEAAMTLVQEEPFDLVISDISMPGMDGIELLKKTKSIHPEMDFIIMTGYASDYSYVDIMDAGAADYMTKPFSMNSALARINRIAREKKNIINLRKMNQELCMAIERANILAREAKEASKAKTFFLASMSHEIRTPLNGIVGYTDMLLDTPLNEEQKSFLKNARFSCETLLSVVNDILDFSKVEAGKLSFEQIGFDPEVLCFDIIDAVRTKIDESKVELLCRVADSVPGQVMGDPHRFRQVLLNLLSNAIKFTSKGSIKICLDSEQMDDDGIKLIVSVIDTGIGVSSNELEKIFRPFIQSENDITHRYGGTGLGLAISRNIAQKMGGDVWAESKINKGSTFYFTACYRTVENIKAKRIRTARLNGKKILISTTSEETHQILSHELGLAGMDVTHINFLDLIPELKKKSGKVFDIAIIDFGKTIKVSVDDFNRRIENLQPRSYPFDFIACSIPVPGIVDSFSKAGFKGYLPTPVSKKKLFQMLVYMLGMEDEKVLDSDFSDGIITSHRLSENIKYTASILLVEDNPVNQKMTDLMLSKAGYMIDIAVDGREAVYKYTNKPDAYDLIFMDINMPAMDGFQATRLIRSFEEKNMNLPKIPILALTANVLDDFRVKCNEAGMDGFLTKPIKRDLVFQAIQQWAGKRK